MSFESLSNIHEIPIQAHKEIEAQKAEAISAVTKKLSEAKAVVADLHRKYEELTGRPIREKKGSGSRVRLSSSEKAELVLKVTEIIKSAQKEISMGEIIKQAGASASATRDAVKKVHGITTTGTKATTLYFVK